MPDTAPDETPPGREVAGRYGRIIAAYLARVDGLSAGDWSRPTPCTEWNVRDLVAHTAAVHRRFLARIDGTEPSSVEPGSTSAVEDLRAELRELIAAVQRALDVPDLAGRVVDSPQGPVPFVDLVGTLLCGDTLIHTWDLARATGQDDRLDPGAVDVTLAFMLARDEEQMRQPGRFRAKVDGPADADAQTRLLLFCGRQVPRS